MTSMLTSTQGHGPRRLEGRAMLVEVLTPYLPWPGQSPRTERMSVIFRNMAGYVAKVSAKTIENTCFWGQEVGGQVDNGCVSAAPLSITCINGGQTGTRARLPLTQSEPVPGGAAHSRAALHNRRGWTLMQRPSLPPSHSPWTPAPP